MASLKFPSPFDHDNVSDFFCDFMDSNKKSRFFSHRYVAKKLKWPISYLNDIIKERKSLTCIRALEFSRFANYSPLDAERLILLGVKKGLPLAIRDRFFLKDVMKKNATSREVAEEHAELIYDLRALAVFEVVKWVRGAPIEPHRIASLIKTVKISPEDVAEILLRIEKTGVIESREEGGYKILHQELLLDEFGEIEQKAFQLHKDFAGSFSAFCDSAKGPAIYHSAFLELKRSQFSEVADRISTLRNWILERAREAGSASKEKNADTLVFQMDMNLFSILDKNNAECL